MDFPRDSGVPGAEAFTANGATPLSRQGPAGPRLAEALVVLPTLLASVALVCVRWQVISPSLHTVVLFGLAAVLAFALSGPVDMLTRRVGNRMVSIVAVYLVVGIVFGAGIILRGPVRTTGE